MNKHKDYKSQQLGRLNIDEKSRYLPKIKIFFGLDQTNWMDITFLQYNQIKKILTNKGDK